MVVHWNLRRLLSEKMTRFGKFVNLIVKIRRNEARKIFLQLVLMKFLPTVGFWCLSWLKKGHAVSRDGDSLIGKQKPRE